jgi:DNA repair protein RadA/Sms
LEPVPLCAFGEIGLTGELRSVGHVDRRLAEAQKFGLGTVITPTGGGRGATEVGTLREALRAALPAAPRAKAA